MVSMIISIKSPFLGGFYDKIDSIEKIMFNILIKWFFFQDCDQRKPKGEFYNYNV